ncbi:TetR family transcriptional regulator [Streptomyces sp. NPDC002328]|uniref:TetR family transcriptional regulator n=1 Tax=Streptomyces sp. NPDC002328 TaxID=3364642 RepID=UPI003677DADD
MAYDSTATKERILAAATAEFAAHGVAGARVDRIAAQAKANKRAIYDYFGDKSKLFAVVLERALAELADAVPPSGDLPGYAENLFDYHRAHPEALRLVMWEALEVGDRPVPAEEARTRHYQDKIRAAASGDSGDSGGSDESGEFGGQGGDARTRVFFTLALAGWSIAMPQLRRMVLGPDYSLDDLRADVARSVRALSATGGASGEE